MCVDGCKVKGAAEGKIGLRDVVTFGVLVGSHSAEVGEVYLSIEYHKIINLDVSMNVV